MALPKTYRAVARLGWTSSTGDPEGELVAHGPNPGSTADPNGRARCSGRTRTRRSRSAAGAPTSWPARARTPSLSERPVTVYRAEHLWADGERAVRDRVLRRDLVRAARRRPRRRLLRGARAHGDRPFPLADADPERVVPLAEALAFLPERDARRGRGGSGRARARRRGRATAGRHMRLDARRGADRDRPSRGPQGLRPVVVFAPREGQPPPRRRAPRAAPLRSAPSTGFTSATARSSGAPTRC